VRLGGNLTFLKTYLMHFGDFLNISSFHPHAGDVASAVKLFYNL